MSATEPTTSQEWNERVAKALELTRGRKHGYPGDYAWDYDEYMDGGPSFDPWTDPAAAKWALERLLKYRPWLGGVTLNFDYRGIWLCKLGLHDLVEGPFTEAICRAIVGAAK